MTATVDYIRVTAITAIVNTNVIFAPPFGGFLDGVIDRPAVLSPTSILIQDFYTFPDNNNGNFLIANVPVNAGHVKLFSLDDPVTASNYYDSSVRVAINERVLVEFLDAAMQIVGSIEIIGQGLGNDIEVDVQLEPGIPQIFWAPVSNCHEVS